MPLAPTRSLLLVLACLLGPALAATGQTIRVLGNDTIISDGDSTPSPADHTDFGGVDVMSGFIDRTFTIQNIGFTTLRIFSIQTLGGAEAEFNILPPGPATIIPNQFQTTFTVRFNPNLGGFRSTSLRILSNSVSSPVFDFTIRGAGTVPAPEINVLGNGLPITDGDPTPREEDHTNFGQVNVEGDGITHTFTIQNLGDLPLEIDSIQALGEDSPLFVITDPVISTIPPGIQVTFTVTYRPDTTGPHRTTIRINNGDSDEGTYDFALLGIGVNISPEIEITGNGVVIAEGDLSPSPADHTSFGNREPGDPGIERSFEIANIGVLDLEILSVELHGGDTGDFSVTGLPASPVATGAPTSMRIHFAPTAPGRRTTTVRLTTNDPVTPVFEFAIQGFGGSFKLLRIERDGPDAVIVFLVNPDDTPSTYIYNLQVSSTLEADWLNIAGLSTTGGVGERSFRVADAFNEEMVFWRVTEVALP